MTRVATVAGGMFVVAMLLASNAAGGVLAGDPNGITNVALGPDQSQGLGTTILGTPFYKVQTGGILVAHGGHLGLGATW